MTGKVFARRERVLWSDYIVRGSKMEFDNFIRCPRWAKDGAVGQCAVYRRSHMTDMYTLDVFARSIQTAHNLLYTMIQADIALFTDRSCELETFPSGMGTLCLVVTRFQYPLNPFPNPLQQSCAISGIGKELAHSIHK
jgi:hypothetical protein